MRKLLQYLFKKPLTWVANKLSAKPEKETVFKSLSKLYYSSKKNNKRVCTIDINSNADKFIIFSDQHKGNKDFADDFANCEFNYVTALKYYQYECFSFINLGDSEELWKYTAEEIIPKNTAAFNAEAAFQQDNKYYKTFGNHDLIWKNKMDVERLLKNNFKMPMSVYEGILLKAIINNETLNVFCTHGHQGDKLSDNNAFSTWLVAHIWTPIQRYLKINVNSPSSDYTLRNKHNKIMYEWSVTKRNVLLITGHTHRPVFASGKYSNHPSNNIDTDYIDHSLKPTYFNSGCCCYNDGDITGIEIADGFIRLIKWHTQNNISSKTILEEKKLEDLMKEI
jgi:predicted phosphodiesterase